MNRGGIVYETFPIYVPHTGRSIVLTALKYCSTETMEIFWIVSSYAWARCMYSISKILKTTLDWCFYLDLPIIDWYWDT